MQVANVWMVLSTVAAAILASWLLQKKRRYKRGTNNLNELYTHASTYVHFIDD